MAVLLTIACGVLLVCSWHSEARHLLACLNSWTVRRIYPCLTYYFSTHRLNHGFTRGHYGIRPCEIPFTQTLIIAFSYPEIFIYGGRVDVNYGGSPATQTINAGLDKVYILSLPSFLWFKANYTSPDPRTDHTYSIVGNRQMLSIGGLSTTAASFSKY